MKRAGITLVQIIVTAAGVSYVFHDPQRRAQIASALRHADFCWIAFLVIKWSGNPFLYRRSIFLCTSAMASVGKTRWAIAEGYIPGESHGPAPEMTSHEACCVLNASEKDAHVSITIFFENRDPVGPYRFTISPRRTKHLRFNNFDYPEMIPRDTPYSSLIESDMPIVVQHTRLDSRQSENALLTTIAFPCD